MFSVTSTVVKLLRGPWTGLVNVPHVTDRQQRLLGYALVAAQTALITVVFGTGRPARRSRGARVAAGIAIGAGFVVATAGAAAQGRHLTAMPQPRASGRLRTGGAYAVVRHPMYSGVMLASVARGLLAGGRAGPAAAAGLCAVLTAKARWEERQLRELYPGYDEYARRTPRFVPRISDLRRR
jgi:protein-S-isoprenylcysteine O-methyltransferase Ste14